MTRRATLAGIYCAGALEKWELSIFGIRKRRKAAAAIPQWGFLAALKLKRCFGIYLGAATGVTTSRICILGNKPQGNLHPRLCGTEFLDHKILIFVFPKTRKESSRSVRKRQQQFRGEFYTAWTTQGNIPWPNFYLLHLNSFNLRP